MENNYFRIPEAAQYLKISRSTFWRLRKTNKIRTVVLNGTKIFRKTDLDEFMEDLAMGRK